VLNLNCSVLIAPDFTVVNYGRSNCIEDLSTPWRKSIPLIWNLLPLTNCYLLPLICRCLPVFDEICHRSLNFVRACVKHESPLVRSLVLYSLNVARNELFFSRKVLCRAILLHG